MKATLPAGGESDQGDSLSDELPNVGIVTVTHGRPAQISRLVRDLLTLPGPSLEIIVVDNASPIAVSSLLQGVRDRVRVIRLAENQGAVARNHGIRESNAELVITLDDDIYGLTAEHVQAIRQEFRNGALAALCFQVREEKSGRIMNWCHARSVETSAESEFETSEISEGAVCLRREAVRKVGGYPAYFFISHEGPDLAIRLLDAGYTVKYTPRVSLIHAVAPEGRKTWRRYYYDSRNVIWLAVRNYPLGYGIRKVCRQLSAMLVYSIRDGFAKYWLRAVLDGLAGIPRVRKDRSLVSPATMRRVRDIESRKPGVWYFVRRRVLRKGVEI